MEIEGIGKSIFNKIKDNIIYNDAENIALYRLTTYQLEKMFRKVTFDKN